MVNMTSVCACRRRSGSKSNSKKIFLKRRGMIIWGGEGKRFQSVRAGSSLGFGLPHTRLKWSMARSKASRTAFLWKGEHDSNSFSRSRDGWIPNGAILDLGSHCQLRLLSKKWTRNSFSSDLNCIRSPSRSTSRGGLGRSSSL